MGMELSVARSVLESLRAEAEAAHPDECCGLLLGGPGESARIERVVPAENVAGDRRRAFEIDPGALIAAFRAEREGGPVVIGYYHSHPLGSAEPSAQDRAQAPRDGRIWAIVAGGEVRFWREADSGFEPLSYRPVSG